MNARLKCVVITGASSGIGEATYKMFARQGFHAVAIARRAAKLENTCAELLKQGFSAHWYECDLADHQATTKIAEQIMLEQGCPDAVVFNAGVSVNKHFSENLPADRMAELTLNYLSPSWLLDVILPHAQKRGSGHFIAVGSLAARTSFPGNATYAASKSALASLWQSLEHEYAVSGIHFSTLLPGLVETEMSKSMKSWIPGRSAEGIADLILRTYEKPAMAQTHGIENQAILAMTRLFPETTQNLMTHFHSFVYSKRAPL